MSSNNNKFGLGIQLTEFFIDLSEGVNLFSDQEMCNNTDDILKSLKSFEKRIKEFIEDRIKNNGDNKNE